MSNVADLSAVAVANERPWRRHVCTSSVTPTWSFDLNLTTSCPATNGRPALELPSVGFAGVVAATGCIAGFADLTACWLEATSVASVAPRSAHPLVAAAIRVSSRGVLQKLSRRIIFGYLSRTWDSQGHLFIAPWLEL